MATKKQKRAAALAKREQFMADLAQSNADHLRKSKEYEERSAAKRREENRSSKTKRAVNKMRVNAKMQEMGIPNNIEERDGAEGSLL